jgi:hypothetical protein
MAWNKRRLPLPGALAEENVGEDLADDEDTVGIIGPLYEVVGCEQDC